MLEATTLTAVLTALTALVVIFQGVKMVPQGLCGELIITRRVRDEMESRRR